MDRERFEKQLNFILEIDKEKQILRQTHIRGYSRQEDDAEHAWHMAVMAFLLQEYSNENRHRQNDAHAADSRPRGD